MVSISSSFIKSWEKKKEEEKRKQKGIVRTPTLIMV